MTSTDSLVAAFDTAEHSIFRLERLQHYAGDPNFDRFLAGEPWQDTESKRHWVDLVQRRAACGVAMQRVHVVDRPWSDYMRFEITWSYPHNVRAGEDVRITAEAREAYGAVGDFWMVDDHNVWAMRYDPAGQLTSVEDMSADAAFIVACREAKTIALTSSEPLIRVTATL
ncbi:MAG: hypothetical protein L0I76_04795 [Pseudonocardia sp.]|nr:hypothetical protein [Pseudonocardia sp.]